METLDYQSSIAVNVTPKEAFDAICRVSEWWATNFKGSSQKLDDIFTVQFTETSVTFKIIEVVPNQKIVWLVTDCYLPWLNDKEEWKGTRINWEISTNEKTTQINFTHIGLVPGLECYDDCKKGWNFHFGKSLYKLITDRKGMPDVMTHSR